MKPIQRAESIKYIILVSITRISRETSVDVDLRVSGISIAQLNRIKLTVFLRNQELVQYPASDKNQFKVVYCVKR